MRRRFLPEVQALRALAVGIVVIYHLVPTTLPGGFIGVDVFFVVSGFLITGHLLREHERSGRISFAAFWAARARRILPAALVCIAVTLGAVYLIYPPTRWTEVGTQGLASALSILNWLLAADAVDYSAATNEATPFQHFWSLGVEEQFYLLWPVVVLAACGLALRRTRNRAVTVSLVFGVVVVASLTASILQAAVADPSAYFTTTTRVWELAIGGLLAVWVPAWTPRAGIRTALSLAGVAAILIGALTIAGDARFPGAIALVPVLGAAAVIVAGATTGVLAPARVYAWRPVQWVGDVSYSLYLWHFPPIVLFTVAVGSPPDLAAAAGLAALAVGAAALSHRFLERPLRRSAWLAVRPSRALALGTACITAVCLVAATLPLSERRVETEWLAAADRLDRAGARGAASPPSAVSADEGMTPAPSRAGADEPRVLAPGCTGVPRSPTTPTCVGGDPDGEVRVALVGDSHAKQWATSVFEIAAERGWRVETYAHASCPFNTEQRIVEADGGVVCADPNRDTMRALLDDPYDIVITANWASGDFVDTATGQPPGVAGYADVWNRLADAGSEVVVIKDVPRPRANPTSADCLGAHYADPDACGMVRSEALQGRDIVDRARVLAPRTHVVDVTDRLCDVRTCPAVIGNVVVYRDTNHLTDTFVRTLTPFIERRLPEGLAAP